MFKNNYQGGAVVEIFSGQGKDPVAKWKLCGGTSAIHKEYNKEVKGFVYCLEGSSQTVKMQMPENGKMSLGLLQRFLVLQVNIPPCKDFSVELVITDSEHLKRRLHLSTVHKELTATLLHAKIPFVGLKRNIWSTLCIDLVSFTAELFKGFLTLDGVTLFATCKVRRMFTMKTEPAGMSDDDMFVSGAGLMDLIPRSCQFPPDVNHVAQMLNMEILQKANMRAGLVNSDCVPDQSGAARSAGYRHARHHGVLHTASGSRAAGAGPPPPTGRKSSAASDETDGSVLFISNTGSPFSRTNQKYSVEGHCAGGPREKLPHGEPPLALHGGTPGRLQPRPLTDRQGSMKPRVAGAGRERPASPAHSDAVPGRHRKRSKTREKSTPPSSRREGSRQSLTSAEKTERIAAECSFGPAKESSRAADTPATESPSRSTRPASSPDPQVWSSWESNEGSEPRLTLQEEVFIFSSQPHSPKRGRGQGDQEKMELGDERVRSESGRRYEAQLEDDFIGSESDEDSSFTKFQQEKTGVGSNPATPRPPDPTSNAPLKAHPKPQNVGHASPEQLSPAAADIRAHSPSNGRATPAGMVPARCLSPGATPSRQGDRCGSEAASHAPDGSGSVTVSRRLLQEVKLDDSPRHKGDVDDSPKPVECGRCDLHLLGSLRMHGDDDEELRMLASLKREQEEDECRASGLSASRIHQCNVSISMSSDDASTWTHSSTPANQGRHYQNEMNPLRHSNPREWMDVLSPPIMPPSRRRRSGNAWSNRENLVGGGDESASEEENEDDYLNLLYDPCLNCYFEPKTGKYYELA